MITTAKGFHKLIDVDGIKYYTVERLPLIQAEMLKLLKIIHKICTDNDISYFMDGGSCIGCIRHKGFIPWDDDLDISLLKEDYLKLESLLMEYGKLTGETVLLNPPGSNNHFCNFFASTSNTRIRYYGSLDKSLIKVDIRPLNVIRNDAKSIDENRKFRDLANYLIFKKTFWDKGKPQLLNKMSIANFYKFYNEEYGLENKNDGIYVHPYYEFSDDFYWTYDDIFPLKHVPFEDIYTFIPNKYDAILRNLYGNYMEFPPLESRVPMTYKVYTTGRLDYSEKIGRLDKIMDLGLVEALKVIINERFIHRWTHKIR